MRVFKLAHGVIAEYDIGSGLCFPDGVGVLEL